MRIDPKYFNRFIGVCVLIAVAVIIFSSIRSSQRKEAVFEKNALALQADTLSFHSFSQQDSLFLDDIPNQVMIIQFWSTWSDKSAEVNRFLKSYADNHPNLLIVAAEVKDGNEEVSEYIDNHDFPFHFVEGTDLYLALETPGVPSQILINREKEITGINVGNDTLAIEKKLNSLLSGQ